jgi:hypothetical protein
MQGAEVGRYAEEERCRGAEVQGAELQSSRWRGGAGARGARADVQMHRGAGAEVQRYRGTEVQRCRGEAEVQRCRGEAEEVIVQVQVLRRCKGA